MKSILYVTAFRPSQVSAGENYSLELIKALTMNNKVDLVYFKRRSESEFISWTSNLKVVLAFDLSYMTRFLSFLCDMSIFPVFNSRFNFARRRKVIRMANSGKYDLIVLDYGQTFLIGRKITEVRKILIAHDVLAQRYLRQNYLAGLWTKISEGKLMRQSNSTIFTFSEKDQELVMKFYGLNSKLTDFFVRPKLYYGMAKLATKYFVFYGRWSRKDNLNGLLWFFNKVHPLIKHKNYTFKIIGSDMPEKHKRRLEEHGVDLLGFVQDPSEIIGNAVGLIAPVFSGAGVKVKVLDTLACGVRVVGTDIALEGIKSELLKFCFVCNSVNEYVLKLSYLMESEHSRFECIDAFERVNNPNLIVNYINDSKNQ